MNNMPNTLKINITQRDLELAMQGDSRGCAISVCINRLYPQLNSVDTTTKWIKVTDPSTGIRHEWRTPDKAVDWLHNWDPQEDRFNAPALVFTLKTSDAIKKPKRLKTAEEKATTREQSRLYRQRIKQDTPVEAKARETMAAVRQHARRNGVTA
jgi:hypothetical protein